MSTLEAEGKKELGNKAFAKNEFDEAIKHYTAAIALDSKNCVYYSNRSASYSGKKDWDAAASDAKECIKINPSFIKGYYRLAQAQSEKNEFEAAIATIQQGLTIEPDNPQLHKQLRQIKAKRATAKRTENTESNLDRVRSSTSIPYQDLDPSVQKEVRDLQEQLLQTTKEYRTVQADILRAQKEKKSRELTKAELEKMPLGSDSKLYRSVGKMFLLASRSNIMSHLEECMEKEGKAEVDLSGKLEFLERRMKSQQQNIFELTKSTTAE